MTALFRSGPAERFAAAVQADLRQLKRIRRSISFGAAVLVFALLIAAIWIGYWLSLMPAFQITTLTPPGNGADITATAKADRDADADYLWAQLLPDKEGVPGGRLVRAIVARERNCPSVHQDGAMKSMRPRIPAVQAAFPIRLCEAFLRSDGEARVGSQIVPPRPADPARIVVIGDTGCRITHGEQQPCEVPGPWGFPTLAGEAAGLIKQQKDGRSIVLHLGDYHYRERQCADAHPVCGGSPFGDNWATWQAEFFKPAAPLLRAAAWVAMRGNHEDCRRAGLGWMFFFALPDAKDSNADCVAEFDSYRLNIGRTHDNRPRMLQVMDTADESVSKDIEQRCQKYLEVIEKIEHDMRDGSRSEVWLALHQPLWRRMQNHPVYSGEEPNPSGGVQPPPPDLKGCAEAKATKSALFGIREKIAREPDKPVIRLVLSGDTHAFQFIVPTTAQTPIQLTAGNGGTLLDQFYKFPAMKADGDTPREVMKAGDPPVLDRILSHGIEAESRTFIRHGFTVLQLGGRDVSAVQYGIGGDIVLTCRFSETVSAAERPRC